MVSDSYTIKAHRQRLMELLASAPPPAERERLELALADSYTPEVLDFALDRLIDDVEKAAAQDDEAIREAERVRFDMHNEADRWDGGVL